MLLWNSITYGPVRSRRLGLSLGLNILPTARKVCNFNCVYCECGLNDKFAPKEALPTTARFERELVGTLNRLMYEGEKIDTLTFAGNGEPTLHPDFPSIIEITREVRDRLMPGASIAVLSDAATLTNERVMSALLRVEKPIMKIDAGSEEMYRVINQPEGSTALTEIVERLRTFDGRVIIQTLFLRGTVNGQRVDNTSGDELSLLIGHYRKVQPEYVMIYSIDRETPYPETLEKIGGDELASIARQIRAEGIETEYYH